MIGFGSFGLGLIFQYNGLLSFPNQAVFMQFQQRPQASSRKQNHGWLSLKCINEKTGVPV